MTAPAPSPADQAVIAAIQLRARQSAAWVLKRRARNYLARPAQLEIFYPGLSCADPRKLIAVGETFLNKERVTPRRHFGFGGEIPAINAKAAIIVGRYLRRFRARLERATA